MENDSDIVINDFSDIDGDSDRDSKTETDNDDMNSTLPAIAPRHALVGKASPGKAASDAKCDSNHPGKIPPG